MSDFEGYSKEILESAKAFLEKAKGFDESNVFARQAHLRSAIMQGFCFLEAHLNYICDHFSESETLDLLERGLLGERDVRLIDGEFCLSKIRKMYSIEDRISFLLRKFSGLKYSGTNFAWKGPLSDAIKIRNSLTHPRERLVLQINDVEMALQAVLDATNGLYTAVFKRPLPYAKLGLMSQRPFD